jgi:hypothetical protein
MKSCWLSRKFPARHITRVVDQLEKSLSQSPAIRTTLDQLSDWDWSFTYIYVHTNKICLPMAYTLQTCGMNVLHD